MVKNRLSICKGKNIALVSDFSSPPMDCSLVLALLQTGPFSFFFFVLQQAEGIGAAWTGLVAGS